MQAQSNLFIIYTSLWDITMMFTLLSSGNIRPIIHVIFVSSSVYTKSSDSKHPTDFFYAQ